jgi:hypothetical protein
LAYPDAAEILDGDIFVEHWVLGIHVMVTGSYLIEGELVDVQVPKDGLSFEDGLKVENELRAENELGSEDG